MIDGKPTQIAIDHDDYHAEHCGVTKDGYQFFLTTPFEPKRGDSEGCEYVALFIFDQQGKIIEEKTIIESFGPRSRESGERAGIRFNQIKEDLGEVEHCRINIAPFAIRKFGTEIGFIARVPEDDDDVWAVELLPGNFMAFFEPWDSGEYDT